MIIYREYYEKEKEKVRERWKKQKTSVAKTKNQTTLQPHEDSDEEMDDCYSVFGYNEPHQPRHIREEKMKREVVDTMKDHKRTKDRSKKESESAGEGENQSVTFY